MDGRGLSLKLLRLIVCATHVSPGRLGPSYTACCVQTLQDLATFSNVTKGSPAVNQVLCMYADVYLDMAPRHRDRQPGATDRTFALEVGPMSTCGSPCHETSFTGHRNTGLSSFYLLPIIILVLLLVTSCYFSSSKCSKCSETLDKLIEMTDDIVEQCVHNVTKVP